jgi:tRNA-specific 2-thiouridylase
MSKKMKKVLVGMSGGVDSSVSAALLLEQGYEVVGAFMKNWSNCEWRADRRDAIRVAAKLGIPLVTLDFERQYRELVVDYLYREYAAGRTPNPDVMCNKFVKFDLFVKEAERLGCDYVATGHYARLERFDRRERSERILAGTDPNKDQTYFLWAIPPAVLPRVLFPVGAMMKSEVRQKARELGLSTADKKDSTGICFVGEVDIRAFLKERITENPGEIVTTNGEVVGTHEGVAFYTIGQRHGLNVGGGTPYYVVDKKPETNTLVVSSNFHPQLFQDKLVAGATNWFRQPEVGAKVMARVRYRQPLQSCSIITSSPPFQGGDQGAVGAVSVQFDDPVRAVTPGQSIVFYDSDEMLGGAVIQ